MSMFEKRREKLLSVLNDGECICFFSGRAPMCSEDEAYPFKVNRNFYYLTGLDRENMILVLRKANEVTSALIFIEPYDEVKAKWVGPRLKSEEVKAISGLKNVMYLEDFKDYINNLYNYNRYHDTFRVYLDLWHYDAKQDKSAADKFAEYLQATYKNVEIKDIHDQIAAMRMIKDETEIAKIRKAIDITKYGVETMMRSIRPGLREMVLDKAFDLALAYRDCKENAFKTIAAGGERATTLHYSDNDQILEDGTLFLCDLGAAHEHYCADISRTFPVNGHFSRRQKEIYDVVLGAQKLVEENARPGITIRDLNDMVIAYYREILPNLGLEKDVSEYYFHGIGHHLGLDTHDITTTSEKVLKAGMVITNEPGLYIADEGIGIRIEDDLLITQEGCENLAKDLLHTTEEIEAFMNR